MANPEDRNKEELESRVEELEKTVKKMVPGRRAVLAGGAAAGAGLLGFGAGSASADLNDGDTQWGSDSNRDDYVVDYVDANTVNTEDLQRTGGQTGTNRPLYNPVGDSGPLVDINGGGDYTDIQKAVNNEWPIFVFPGWNLDIADGDYSAQGDINIPPCVCMGIRPGDESNDSTPGLIGNQTTPSNVKTGAINVDNVVGYGMDITGFEITQPSNTLNEDSALNIIGSSHVDADNLILSGTFERAIVAYGGSQIGLASTGTIDLTGSTTVLLETKHGGEMFYSNVNGGDITASTGTVSAQYARVSRFGGPMYFAERPSGFSIGDLEAIGAPIQFGDSTKYKGERSPGSYGNPNVSSGTGQTVDTGLEANSSYHDVFFVSYKVDSGGWHTQFIFAYPGGDNKVHDVGSVLTNTSLRGSGGTYDYNFDASDGGSLYIWKMT